MEGGGDPIKPAELETSDSHRAEQIQVGKTLFRQPPDPAGPHLDLGRFCQVAFFWTDGFRVRKTTAVAGVVFASYWVEDTANRLAT